MDTEQPNRDEALYALALMWNQYCGAHGHDHMAAGEHAARVLYKAGLLLDERSIVFRDSMDELAKRMVRSNAR